MVHPFFLQLLQPQLDVQLLLDPCYQLSGDGQLRELMQERRRHLVDGSGGLWYLSPERLAELRFCGLELSAGSNEALAIREPRAAEWLQLRSHHGRRGPGQNPPGRRRLEADRLQRLLPRRQNAPAASARQSRGARPRLRSQLR